MRILRSWPFATLLLGIAALMGINAAAKAPFGGRAALSDGEATQHADAAVRANESSAIPIIASRSGASFGQTDSAYLVVANQAPPSVASLPASDFGSQAAVPTETSEAFADANGQPFEAPDRVENDAPDNPTEDSSLPYKVETATATADLPLAPQSTANTQSYTPSDLRPLATVDNASDLERDAEPYFGWSAIETASLPQALPQATTQTRVQARQCGKCQDSEHKGDCPKQVGAVQHAIQEGGNAQRAAAVAVAAQCQELSSVTPAPSGEYQFAPLNAPHGQFVETWLSTQPPQPVNSSRHDDAVFVTFGPQAALVRHLVQLHEQLGELRGEASLRESVIAMTSENASMATQLEAMKGHHELMEKLVQQTIEMTQLRAEHQYANSTQARPQRQPPTTSQTVAVDPTAQQARMDDLRRENQQLRVELDAIRAQLQAIARPAVEPEVLRY